MAQVAPDSTQTARMLTDARSGDRAAFNRLFARHRPHLRKVIAMRLDPQLRARVDASDVVQETQAAAFDRLEDYLARQPMPFRLWLRKTAHERLIALRRRHLEAARRAVGREISLPDGSALKLAENLVASGTSPSQRLARKEIAQQVRAAVAQLPDMEREILIMRNFEELTNQEVACVLDVDPAVVSRRLGRSVMRLRDILLENGFSESQP